MLGQEEEGTQFGSLFYPDVEVVRCKDCTHYTPLGIDGAWGRCAIHSSPTEHQRMCQAVDFCAWGERRKDE